MNRRSFLGATAGTLAGVACSSPRTTARREPPSDVASITAVCLAPDGAVVLADWRRGLLHRVDRAAGGAVAEQCWNVRNLSDRLARATARPTDEVHVSAAAFDVRSQTLLLGLTLGRGATEAALVAVHEDGGVERFDLGDRALDSVVIESPPPDARIWRDTPARSLTVTDMKFHGGRLLVSGLANDSFRSTLRQVPYPFVASAAHATGIEIYHAVHGQMETRAPIRCFDVVELNGAPHLLAAYTCTPLVTIPVAALEPGAAVRGKTIAELGFGNTPRAVVPFTIEHEQKREPWVAIANSSKSADLLRLADVATAARGEGLSERVAPPFDSLAGLRALPLPLTGSLRLVDQGGAFLLSVRRDADSGQLQAVSVRKGAFFRLSDFVNEYDLPSYDYPTDDVVQQQYIRPFHRMMRGDEGYPELAR
mgnify:CR=1 FL=1